MKTPEPAKRTGRSKSVRRMGANLAHLLGGALLVIGHQVQALNVTWTGEATTDLMSDPSNWADQAAPDVSLDYNEMVFGPLAEGAHEIVGVDLAEQNLGPVIFTEGAPSMTLRAVPPNEGRVQLAHARTSLRIANRSGQTQTFQIPVHVFWHDESGAPIRRFEATSGDLAFSRMVVLRGDLALPEAKEVVWELTGDGNMDFGAVVMPAEKWPPECNLSLLKTGSGRVTFKGETKWRGSATIEEGTVVIDGPWEVSADLVIGPAATLEGKGQINAPVRVQGKLSPGGAEIATLKFAKGLELSGTTEMSLDAAAKSSDCANVTSGPLTYGGVLRVTSTGPSKFTRGQAFQLFQWKDQPPAGAFTKVELPPLPSGLRWTDKLAEDGTIVVGP
jgi:autotransporter-associated beta strand protein